MRKKKVKAKEEVDLSKVFQAHWCWTHSGHQVQMLLRAAEVLGQVVHAEVFMLAGVDPGSVLL